jgi:hypothetical protein
MSTLIKCIQNFSDVNTQAQCLQDFYIAHCPYYADKTASKQYHFKVVTIHLLHHLYFALFLYVATLAYVFLLIKVNDHVVLLAGVFGCLLLDAEESAH